MTGSLRGSFEASLHRGGAALVADSIAARLTTPESRVALTEYLRTVFGDSRAPANSLASLLASVPFAAVVTGNLDSTLEQAFGVPGPRGKVFLQRDVKQLLNAITHGEFFFLKLHGSLELPDSVLIASDEYESRLRTDPPFSEFLQQLFVTRKLLFVGSSFEGIEASLRGLRLPNIGSRNHYALVGVTEPGWEALGDALERRFGTRILPYDARGGHSEVRNFIVELRRRTTHRSGAGARKAGSRVRSLVLKDIGPFDELEVELDPSWNLLLGDNGVGKSTILRAIALSVAGKLAGGSAAKLLKVGSTSGQITLRTDSGTEFITTLAMNSIGGVEVNSIGPRAFEGTNSLVLAFPPVRTIASGVPRAPQQPAEDRGRPLLEDVMPILASAADPRILAMKQWVLDLDYQRKSGENLEVLDTFFVLLRQLLAEGDLRLLPISGNEIKVQTRDGPLPIDSLSWCALDFPESDFWILKLPSYGGWPWGDEDTQRSFAAACYR